MVIDGGTEEGAVVVDAGSPVTVVGVLVVTVFEPQAEITPNATTVADRHVNRRMDVGRRRHSHEFPATRTFRELVRKRERRRGMGCGRCACVAFVGLMILASCADAERGSNVASPDSTAPPPAEPSADAQTDLTAPITGDVDEVLTRPWVDKWFRYEGEIPELTSPATAWYFPDVPAPSEATIARLAASFGATGAVTPLADDFGWSVGPNDGSGARLVVEAGPMQHWQVMDRSYETPDMVNCPTSWTVPGVDPSAGTPTTLLGVPEPTVVVDRESCIAYWTPAGVPSAADAEAHGSELLGEIGVDLTHSDLSTTVDQYGASLIAHLRLDGVPSDLAYGVTFAEAGSVEIAFGYLASPVPGTTSPRIGVRAALSTFPDAADAPSWVTYPPCEEGACNSAAPGPPTIVTLSNARASLSVIGEMSATEWVLPSYSFDGSDGSTYSVLAYSKRICTMVVGHEPPPL